MSQTDQSAGGPKLVPLTFELSPPLDPDTIKGHIAHSLSLGLPTVKQGKNRGPINIIASGPSAKEAPLDGPTIALNGALGLFTRSGKAPTYWAACDPRERIADFLTDAPEETTYLVASKCHPKVFEALKGKRVLLWHLNDFETPKPAVPSAVSITLCAMSLLRYMGYNKMDVWGWDGCYGQDGSHHVSHQPHEEDGTIIHLPDGQAFNTTMAWGMEAEDALIQLTLADYQPTIHGNGMFQAILKNPQLRSTYARRLGYEYQGVA